MCAYFICMGYKPNSHNSQIQKKNTLELKLSTNIVKQHEGEKRRRSTKLRVDAHEYIKKMLFDLVLLDSIFYIEILLVGLPLLIGSNIFFHPFFFFFLSQFSFNILILFPVVDLLLCDDDSFLLYFHSCRLLVRTGKC